MSATETDPDPDPAAVEAFNDECKQAGDRRWETCEKLVIGHLKLPAQEQTQGQYHCLPDGYFLLQTSSGLRLCHPKGADHSCSHPRLIVQRVKVRPDRQGHGLGSIYLRELREAAAARGLCLGVQAIHAPACVRACKKAGLYPEPIYMGNGMASCVKDTLI